MDSEYIGSIQIFDDCSTIDLPDEMPSEVLEMLQKTVVCGKRLNMAELSGSDTLEFVDGLLKAWLWLRVFLPRLVFALCQNFVPYLR
jgi:ATP-dependent RNA helicase DeaD